MFTRLATFTAAFIILACLVTVIPAAVYPETDASESEHMPDRAEQIIEATEKPTVHEDDTASDDESSGYIPRTEAPSYDNACYYSDENAFYAASYGMPNCTCYAWGRAYELLGEKPRLCLYDAGCWYDYNLENGVYACGDIPERGAIACWAYADGGPGHVAVVESVDGDTVTFSNSAYNGAEFYLSAAPVSDPSNGMENWIFQGYIYPKKV